MQKQLEQLNEAIKDGAQMNLRTQEEHAESIQELKMKQQRDNAMIDKLKTLLAERGERIKELEDELGEMKIHAFNQMACCFILNVNISYNNVQYTQFT